MVLRSWCLVLLGLTVTACGASDREGMVPLTADVDDENRVHREAFSVVLGMGNWCFTPYTDDTPLWLQRGAQGGQHLETVILVNGLRGAEEASFRVRLVDDEGETVLGTEMRRALFEEAGDVSPVQDEDTLIQRDAYLFVPAPEQIIGQYLTIWLQVTLADGRSAVSFARGPLTWLQDEAAQQLREACHP